MLTRDELKECRKIAETVSDGHMGLFFFDTVQLGGLLTSAPFKANDRDLVFSMWCGEDDGREVIVTLRGNTDGIEELKPGDHLCFDAAYEMTHLRVREWSAETVG